MKLSIIVPVFNVAPYIADCLNSVCSQDFQSWELICVDDGSTDDSGLILDHYAKIDGRIRVYHQKNSGVSVARNNALKYVTGEWITYLDGDDLYADGALDEYRRLITEYPCVDAFFLDGVCRFDKKPNRQIVGSGHVQVLSERPISGKSLLSKPEHGMPVIKLLKSTMFRQMSFPPGVSMMEDRLQLVDLLTTKARWATVDRQVYCYRMRAGSATKTKPQDRCRDVVKTFYDISIGAKEKLQYTDEDFREFWRYSAGTLEYHLRLALMFGDKCISQEAAQLYLRLERLSNSRILNSAVRLECWVLDKFCARYGFSIIEVVERVLRYLIGKMKK